MKKTCTQNFAGMTFEFLLEWCVYTVIFQERHLNFYRNNTLGYIAKNGTQYFFVVYNMKITLLHRKRYWSTP